MKIPFSRTLVFFCALAALPLSTGRPSIAAGGESRLVIVVADRLDLYDLADPSLRRLNGMLYGAAAGLMSTRALARNNPAAACATIGSGVRAASPLTAAEFLNVRDNHLGSAAGGIYFMRTLEPVPENGIINIEIARLISANQRTTWKARPGAVGTLLREHGIGTAMLGNSDTDETRRREAALIIMDETGAIPAGDVSKRLLARDPGAPFGLSLDMEKLQESFAEAHLRNRVVVVDFGETARADYFRERSLDAGYDRALARAMALLDHFMGFVMKTVDLKRTRVILLSPTPKAGAYAEARTLTPILMIGGGIERGLLTSRTTRTRGLVSNVDVAPTVLAYFSIPVPSFMLGSPATVIRAKDKVPFLMRFHDRDQFVESRSRWIWFIIIFQLTVLALAYITTVRLPLTRPAWLQAMLYLILAAASLDLAVLLAAFIETETSAAYAATVMAMTGLFVGMLSLVPGAARRMIVLCGAYTAALVADQLLGAPLSRESLLGYYPQIGARYYGLGNEYMGFLIGGPVAASAFALDLTGGKPWVKFLSAAAFAGILFVVASPGFGANAGGLVACGFAYLWMIWLIFGGRADFRAALAVVTVLVVIFGGFFLYDALFTGGEASHFGRLAERAGGGNWEEVSSVIVRKLGTNLHLLRVSRWSMLFTTLAIISFALYFFPFKHVERLFARYVYFGRGFAVCMAGAAVAFAANDSGITPGAICLILPLASIFTLLFSTQPGALLGRPGAAERHRMEAER
ncbi:MAG: hypothetical protein AB1742_12805 [bacterium]